MHRIQTRQVCCFSQNLFVSIFSWCCCFCFACFFEGGFDYCWKCANEKWKESKTNGKKSKSSENEDMKIEENGVHTPLNDVKTVRNTFIHLL